MTREQYLNDAFGLLKPLVFPHIVEWPPVKFSISDLPKSTLGICYARAASSAGLNEIFITATSGDTDRILKIMVHELIHAILDCKGGHGAAFKSEAHKAGLRAPYATAKNGDLSTSTDLDEAVTAIVEALGPIPHSELKKPAPKKGRNNNKLVCSNCGWQANTSNKHIRTTDGQLIHGAQCFACLTYSVDAIQS